MKEIKKKTAYSSVSEDKEEQGITVVTRQKGVTLIEIVVYMAIALIFIALAGGRIFDAFSSQGAQTETDNIISLISATKETRGRAGYGTGDLNKTLIALGRVPNALSVIGDSTINNSWDGSVKVTAAGANLNSFTVSSEKIPKAACIKMVQRISETGLVEKTNTTVGIITSSAAVGICKDKDNNITWTVKG